jgi:hypothetical protein
MAARADITFGTSARFAGMAGAGLALTDRPSQSSWSNPAALALQNRRVAFSPPQLNLRATNVRLGEIVDDLKENPDSGSALNLVRDFGKTNTGFGGDVSMGLRFGHVELSASGTAQFHLSPNAAYQTWARTPGAPLPALFNGRADVLAAGIYSLPSIAIAEHITPAHSKTRVSAGIRLNAKRAYYTHFIVDQQAVADNAALRAPELGDADNLTNSSGLGVDFGLLIHSNDKSGWSGAMVVTDLVEPKLTFAGTDTAGNPFVYNLQPRSVSAGTAYRQERLATALDVIDLTGAYGSSDVRMGMEYKTRGISLRAGFSSARGLAVGIGFSLIDVSIGGRSPITLSHMINF